MRINNNIMALNAHRQLGVNQSKCFQEHGEDCRLAFALIVPVMMLLV
jgi:hypothetical protein